MELQLREKEIFETLKQLKNYQFVVIGGYAINAYTLPRFSVDCDIVVNDAKKIEKQLLSIGYSSVFDDLSDVPYHGNFNRYKKKINENISVSVDIMIREVLDRQTDAIFSAEWIFKNSKVRTLRGKTIEESLKLRIINIDALFVMKMISCRSTDIRDVFMLAPDIRDKQWIKDEVSKRYNFDDRFNKIWTTITSAQFRDGLQGVFGSIPNGIFEKHRKSMLKLNQF